MITGIASQTNVQARAIPGITDAEAHALLQAELERFLRLLETLEPGDWSQPTACTAWNVREVVAHQAGGYASGTGYREMIRQYTARPKPGQLPEDAVNDLQVSERAGRSPDQLIAELRQAGPAAAQNWAYGFRLARLVTIPHPVPGSLSLRHLFQVIHSRDTWMHRLDICRATGRPFEQTPEHDGRIVALVLRDVARQLGPRLGSRAIRFDLSGIAGGSWQVGSGEPAAVVQMDALEFNILASGRTSLETLRSRIAISGDTALAETLLKGLLILY